MKKRLDFILVEHFAVKSRSQAQLLIKSGGVLLDGEVVQRASFLVDESELVRNPHLIQFSNPEKETFVGRGGYKLQCAIENFAIALQGKVVADIGASTGGFTEYVLRCGAEKVFAIDVGHGQLDISLRQNYQVVNLEGINARYPIALPTLVHLVVIDVSFISLRLILTNAVNILLKQEGKIVALFKPQFEGRPEDLKKGIVRSPEVRQKIILDFYEWCQQKKLYPQGIISSPILGKEGNKEYLFLFVPNALERPELKQNLHLLS